MPRTERGLRKQCGHLLCSWTGVGRSLGDSVSQRTVEAWEEHQSGNQGARVRGLVLPLTGRVTSASSPL